MTSLIVEGKEVMTNLFRLKASVFVCLIELNFQRMRFVHGFSVNRTLQVGRKMEITNPPCE